MPTASPFCKGDLGLPWRDLVAICRNLAKQLCSISLSHNVSRPGLGQGGFSNTARVY